MLRKLLSFFDQNTYRREVARYVPLVERINAYEGHYQKLDAAGLRAITGQLRERLHQGAGRPDGPPIGPPIGLEDVMPEAFAAVREAARRTVGLRHYDVQLIGGIVLQRGAIAEMRTGEGKTLVATLPLYLNALEGKGAHLVTVNDYLARRDARWMGPIFELLGMSVGVLQAEDDHDNDAPPMRRGYRFDPEHVSTEERFNRLRLSSRAEAYAADITYGTNSEFGFDYLRDNLVGSLEEKVQRGHHFAIVDEVDNILIDEARTPLIISGENRSEIEWYGRMAQVVGRLGRHEVEINAREQSVSLTPGGEKHVAALLGRALVDPAHPEEASLEQRHLIGHLEQALRARFLYLRDRHYLVQNGQVVIVDEYTGRMMPGRRWTDGLHQAVEAREGLEVQPESMTYATISLQNYFRMYAKLSGMTGTALTAAREFEKTYHLQVHPIPTHVEYQSLGKDGPLRQRKGQDPSGLPFTYYVRKDDPQAEAVFWQRLDYPDVLYGSAEAKRRAITWEILSYHSRGQPLLVGTTSVADSEELVRYLEAPMLGRLAQAHLLRQAWLRSHPEAHPELPVEALSFLAAPLGLVSPARLEQASAALQLDPNPLAHLAALLDLLGVDPGDASLAPRLETALRTGISNLVLNARYHYEESQIIAGGGAYGSVIIATNMAGRGVDIKLGGELAEEVLAAVNQVLEQAGVASPYTLTLAERWQALQQLGQAAQAASDHRAEADFFLNYMSQMERVRQLGGLHVIGSARHEARRIDHQLRGRAARQGDPGSSRFFISLEDELMVRFGGLEAQAFGEQEALRGGDPQLPAPAEAGRRVIEAAQKRVEDENFEIRRHLLEYDDVINAQRRAIYAQRDRILSKPDLSDDLAEMLQAELQAQAARSLGSEAEGNSWQFIEWVDRLQPSLARPDGGLYPAWTLQVILARALPDLPAQPQPGLVRAAFEALVQQALLAEQRFAQAEATRQCQMALDELQAAVSERMALVDAALDSLRHTPSARRQRQVLKALSQAAGLPVQLSEAGWQALDEKPRQVAIEVLDQLEPALLHSAAQHLAAALERLLGLPPDPDPVVPPPASAAELVARVQAAVQAAFEQRRRFLLGSPNQPHGWLAGLLEQALPEQALQMQAPEWEGGLGVPRALALLDLLRLPAAAPSDQAVGNSAEAAVDDAAAAPDSPAAAAPAGADGPGSLKTAEENRVDRLPAAAPGSAGEPAGQDLPVEAPLARQAMPPITYVFLVDELLANTPPEEIAGLALAHLSEAQRVLKTDLGADQLNGAYRQLLLATIDERWVDYLTRLEELRYEVRLEGMAHNDPLVMYKSRASSAYAALLVELRQASVAHMFTFLSAARSTGDAEASALEKAAPRLTYLKLG